MASHLAYVERRTEGERDAVNVVIGSANKEVGDVIVIVAGTCLRGRGMYGSVVGSRGTIQAGGGVSEETVNQKVTKLRTRLKEGKSKSGRMCEVEYWKARKIVCRRDRVEE